MDLLSTSYYIITIHPLSKQGTNLTMAQVKKKRYSNIKQKLMLEEARESDMYVNKHKRKPSPANQSNILYTR